MISNSVRRLENSFTFLVSVLFVSWRSTHLVKAISIFQNRFLKNYFLLSSNKKDCPLFKHETQECFVLRLVEIHERPVVLEKKRFSYTGNSFSLRRKKHAPFLDKFETRTFSNLNLNLEKKIFKTLIFHSYYFALSWFFLTKDGLCKD